MLGGVRDVIPTDSTYPTFVPQGVRIHIEGGFNDGQIPYLFALGQLFVDFFQKATLKIAVSVNATTRKILKHYRAPEISSPQDSLLQL